MPGSLTTPNGIKYFDPSDTSSWSNGINPALLKIDELVTELKDTDSSNLNQLTEEITGVANRTTSLETAMGVAQGNINSNASAVSNINATIDTIVPRVTTNETAIAAKGTSTILFETVTSGDRIIDLSPYKYLELDWLYNTNVHRKALYPIDALIINETVEDGWNVGANYFIGFSFIKTTTGLHIHPWSFGTGWSFKKLIVRGIK